MEALSRFTHVAGQGGQSRVSLGREVGEGTVDCRPCEEDFKFHLRGMGSPKRIRNRRVVVFVF